MLLRLKPVDGRELQVLISESPSGSRYSPGNGSHYDPVQQHSHLNHLVQNPSRLVHRKGHAQETTNTLPGPIPSHTITMGAFPSHSAPSGYSQEISLKKKSLALLQSSRSQDTATQPTSPQPQPYPETYTVSSSASLASPPSAPSPATTTRKITAPNFADSPSMSDSQCTTSTSSPLTSDPGSTPEASSSSEGDMSPTSDSNSPASETSKSPSQVTQKLSHAETSTRKLGTKRAAPSP